MTLFFWGGGGGKGVIDHVSHIVRWGDWVKLSMPPPSPFTDKFIISIIHTNYFSFVPI